MRPSGAARHWLGRGVLAIGLATGVASAAAPPPPDTPAGILSFGEELLGLGDSFRAATELLRFWHHFPEDPQLARALEGLGRAYASAGRWQEAVGVFSQRLALAPDPEARLLLGAALYRGARYREAADLLLAADPTPPAALLGTLAHLRADDGVPLPATGRADLGADFAALPRKSAGLATTLAVVPGLGHLYAGRPRDAALSFAVNGLFIWGTYEAVRRENWPLAGVLGLFELGWYSGNLVSAANAAHKWNERSERRFLQRWEGGVLPSWSLAPQPGGASAIVSWRW